jgi:hypothetical protein
MPSPLELETILSEFDDKSEAWVLQDANSKKYVTVPDPRYPAKNPIRFFLRREDAEALLVELLDQNPQLRDKERSGPTNLNNPISGFSAESGHDTPQKNGEPHGQTIPS